MFYFLRFADERGRLNDALNEIIGSHNLVEETLDCNFMRGIRNNNCNTKNLQGLDQAWKANRSR